MRFAPRPQSLIRALVLAGCVRLGLALLAGSGRFGVSQAATAVEWIACAGSLILLAWLDGEVQKHHPGISSLFRLVSCAALAGSLLPNAASLPFFTGMGAAPALVTALTGWALTLLAATLLQWLLRDVRVNGPLPSEGLVLVRLAALQNFVERIA